MHITGLYAALGTLIVLILVTRIIQRRIAAQVGIGAGGDEILARRIRAHGNAIETLPLGLILLLVLELNQTQSVWLHAFGIALVVGRALHAFGLSSTAGRSKGRGLGMLLTLLALIGMSLLLLWQYIGLAVL